MLADDTVLYSGPLAEAAIGLKRWLVAPYYTVAL